MPVIVISLRDGMHHNTNRYCLFCFRIYFLHIQPTSHHIPITHVLHPCSQSPFCPSTPEHNKREVNPTLRCALIGSPLWDVSGRYNRCWLAFESGTSLVRWTNCLELSCRLRFLVLTLAHGLLVNCLPSALTLSSHSMVKSVWACTVFVQP